MATEPNNLNLPNSVELSLAEIDAAKRDYRLLRRLAIAALVVTSASAFAFNFVDPDLWGHVKYGEELLADGQLPATATHTFTAEGYRWINHENLAEIVFAVGFDKLGVAGMLVAKCLLGLLIAGMMYHVARRYEVRALTAWFLLLLVATNLKAFFQMRPQLLSFLWCSVILLLLEYAYRDWRKGSADGRECRVRWAPLVAVLAVLIVWVNSHGAFVAGICILGALTLGRMIEAAIVDRHASLRTQAGLTLFGLATLGAMFINPYGVGLVEWLAESLGSPRPEITEWAAPNPRYPIFWPFVALLATTVGAWAFTTRRRDWTQLAIIMLVGWQATSHLRHIAFFALLTGFWTAPHLQAALSRLRKQAAQGLPVTNIGPKLKWTAATALIVATALQTYSLGRQLSDLPVSRSSYPIDAVAFIDEHDLNGRLLVCFNWAQYALAALPESTVSFDGRFRTCYPQEVVDMHFDFLLRNNDYRQGDPNSELGTQGPGRFRSPESGPMDPTKALEYGDPELVLLDRTFPYAVETMQQVAAQPNSRWSLLYQDGTAQLWGRKRVFDDPASDRFVAEADRIVREDLPEGSVTWPAFPQRRAIADADSPAEDDRS